MICKHCSTPIHETTMAGLPDDHPLKKQLIHTHTGSAYCNSATNKGDFAEPQEKRDPAYYEVYQTVDGGFYYTIPPDIAIGPFEDEDAAEFDASKAESQL